MGLALTLVTSQRSPLLAVAMVEALRGFDHPSVGTSTGYVGLRPSRRFRRCPWPGRPAGRMGPLGVRLRGFLLWGSVLGVALSVFSFCFRVFMCFIRFLLFFGGFSGGLAGFGLKFLFSFGGFCLACLFLFEEFGFCLGDFSFASWFGRPNVFCLRAGRHGACVFVFGTFGQIFSYEW